MSKVAFELRADHEDFSGGSIALTDGEAFDVGKALQEGGGKIVLDPSPATRKGEDAQAEENARAARDELIADALRNYPALKTTTVESAPAASTSKKKEGDS